MKQLTYQTELLGMERLVNTVQELSLARDIEAVMHIVRTVARELTGADGATFVLRDEGMCYYADEDAISPLWKGSRFPMDTCISGWVMLNKKPALIEDIYNDDRIPLDAYRPTFVKSLAMVPIRTIEPIGAIGNYWASRHHPSKKEVALLQALADITAVSIENIEVRNKLKEKLKERTLMLKQLEEQKSQLEEFCNITAHNLRAPLSNLLLISDMITSSKKAEEKLMYLEKQKPVINLLNEVFEELVDATQVRMDFTIERDHIDLETCIKAVMNQLRSQIEDTKAVIKYDFSENRMVWFPKKYMDSILFNLLSNAIKFRSPDNVPEVNIKSYKKDGWVYLEIKDDGLGIDLKKYGDKVFKLRKTFHQHPESRGFGLFITKTQVEALGGSMYVESLPGKGSTFTIKLHKLK